MKKLILILLMVSLVGCATTMSRIQEDLSKKLTDYTICPSMPIFQKPLQNITVGDQPYIAMSEPDFNKLDHYVTELEVCNAKRLLDIVYRNQIIQNLLKQ